MARSRIVEYETATGIIVSVTESDRRNPVLPNFKGTRSGFLLDNLNPNHYLIQDAGASRKYRWDEASQQFVLRDDWEALVSLTRAEFLARLTQDERDTLDRLAREGNADAKTFLAYVRDDPRYDYHIKPRDPRSLDPLRRVAVTLWPDAAEAERRLAEITAVE